MPRHIAYTVVHMSTHVYLHVHMGARVPAHLYIHIHTHTCACTCIGTFTQHTCSHMYTLAHIDLT